MKNRILLLLTMLATLTVVSPAFAAPPVDGSAMPEIAATEPAAPAKVDPPPAPHQPSHGDPTEPGTDEGKTAKPAEIQTDDAAVEGAESLYAALVNRDWALAIAFGLMLVVFGLRKAKVLSKIPSKAIPGVTALLAMAGYVAAALMSPEAQIGPAIMEGAAAGAAAVGFWEMVLKHFLGSKKS